MTWRSASTVDPNSWNKNLAAKKEGRKEKTENYCIVDALQKLCYNATPIVFYVHCDVRNNLDPIQPPVDSKSAL